MLAAMFIGVFILGVIAGIAAFFAFAKWASGMSTDELADTGAMLIDASKNRETTIALVRNDEVVDAYTLEKK